MKTYNDFISKFYLVVNWDKAVDSIIKGQFDGIKGISKNKAIIKRFLDVRNTLLVMDYKDTLKINDLYQINYNNVNDVIKNDFRIIRRITMNDRNSNINDEYQSILLFNSFSRTFDRYTESDKYKYNKFFLKINKNKELIIELKYKYAKYFDRNSHDISVLYDKQKPNINNLNEFIEWFYSILPLLKKENKNNIPYGDTPYNIENFEKEKWYEFFKILFLEIVSHHKEESEWLVNGNFYIPKGTTIYIKKRSNDTYFGSFGIKDENEIREQIKKLDLNKKYNFIFINSEKELL